MKGESEVIITGKREDMAAAEEGRRGENSLMGRKGRFAVLAAVGCRRLASPAAPTAAGKVGDFTGGDGAATEPIICSNRSDLFFC